MTWHGAIGELNGNGTTAAGYVGAAAGSLIAEASKNALISDNKGQVTATASEGFLTGNGNNKK